MDTEQSDIKILIADDHYLVVEGLSALIENEDGLQVAGIASSGRQVLDLVATKEPDLILMDINMPDLDGIQTTRLLKRFHPKVKVLVISMYNTVEFVSSAMEFGASGYLQKNTSIEELHAAIDKVLKGGTYFSKEVEKVYKKGAGKRQKYLDPSKNMLTRREVEIVKLLVKEKTHEEIAELLQLSPSTIQTHRRNIMSKLNVKNFAGMVKYAVHRGWD